MLPLHITTAVLGFNAFYGPWPVRVPTRLALGLGNQRSLCFILQQVVRV